MVLLAVDGVDVDFPYPPYPAQLRYMAAVIRALRAGDNALLESPTGTGKTLCLLCAALAWRAVYVAALQARARATPGAAQPGAALAANAGLRAPRAAPLAALDALVRGGGGGGDGGAAHLAAPRVVFASRTHTQLAQAVAELKKTVYKPFMSVLASRDQLCLHDAATSASGARLSALCRRLTAPARRACRFHHAVMSSRPHENRASELLDKVAAAPPADIEDMRAFGARENACPYFLSRLAARSDACEVLFLPYNYLLDRATRHSLDIDWTNDIVIIDEAHNVEAVAADAMSFDLPASLRLQCDAELSKLLEAGLRPGGIAIPALEAVARSDAGIDNVIGTENRELLEIRLMRTVLASLENFVAAVQFDRGQNSDVAFRVFPGAHLRSLMEAAGGPTRDSYELFLEMLDRAMGVQADRAAPRAEQQQHQRAAANSAIRVLHTAIRVLFESVLDGDPGCFRTVVHAAASKPAAGRTLSYWCFKPAIAMKSINNLHLRCLLLTSGTLSPMDSFAAELGLPFPVRLENPHVVTKPQVWAGVIRSGPDGGGAKGGRLTSAFHARGEASSVELGRALLRIASVVPDGLLVFFPSYGSLYSCMDVWKNVGPGANRAKPSIWELLLRHKRIVAEERESSKFAAAILAHRANVDARAGSILLAVCRGKVSEGIDFSDEYGRAVVITGLPYPSALDPRIVLKREFADEESKKGPRRVGRGERGVLSGSEWYTVQALRAVNQAVGRAIRHRFDYGAIVLCEERFQSPHLQEQISKWIRPSLSVCKTFADAESSLQRFYSNAVSSEFAKAGEKQRLELQKRMAESTQKREEDGTEAVLVAQQAIKSLAPPPRTEQQFLEQVLRFSDEINATKKRKPDPVATAPTARLLDFSQNARGGLLDSGALRIATQTQTPTKDGPKRSARFLAARAERIDEQFNGQPAKRPRGTEAKDHKLSDRIRDAFEKQHQREFLGMFRDVLSAHARLKEGVGPLLTASSATREQERGEKAVTDVVRFTRSHGAEDKTERLLCELRGKIPGAFRGQYDAEVKR